MIRRADFQDIDLINSLAKVIFSDTYMPILSEQQVDYMFDMMYAPCNIERQMEGGHQYFIAEADGKPCGYLSVRKKGQGSFHLEKIYTLPQFHGLGVGRSLFEFACNYALQGVQSGSCLLELNVNRYNKRALAFYKKMGMREARRTDEHVGGGFYANDYVMAIDLSRCSE